MLTKKLKTHRRMPPQSAALEGRSADKTRVPSRNGIGRDAACQRGREERVGPVSPIPSPTRECGASVSSPEEKGYSPKGTRKEAWVCVLGRQGSRLMPCKTRRARELLASGRAVVVSCIPFVIRLKDRNEGATQPIQLKIDPGSKVTGMALVRESQNNPQDQTVIYLAEVSHRSETVHKNLVRRSQLRRRRRGANTQYRPKRFHNRTRKEGWLPPSLCSRINNIVVWTTRFKRIAPITKVTIEDVKFDMQIMQDPEIRGTLYRQGTLQGYEMREYLLEKWGRRCAYCDKDNVPLQVEHIVPLARNGTNRPSNLTLACEECNQKKGARAIEEYLAEDPGRLAHILSHTKTSLRDAAAVNTMRKALVTALKKFSLPIETASGGRTKYNRQRMHIPKTHCLDAACVGVVSHVHNWNMPVLSIKASGRGSYQRTRVDAYGFPRGYLLRKKKVFGFQTGDSVTALVPTGKKEGKYTGRIAVRASGSFNIQTATGTIQGISWKHCRLSMRADGYAYSVRKVPTVIPNPRGAAFPPHPKGWGLHAVM